MRNDSRAQIIASPLPHHPWATQFRPNSPTSSPESGADLPNYSKCWEKSGTQSWASRRVSDPTAKLKSQKLYILIIYV